MNKSREGTTMRPGSGLMVPEEEEEEEEEVVALVIIGPIKA